MKLSKFIFAPSSIIGREGIGELGRLSAITIGVAIADTIFDLRCQTAIGIRADQHTIRSSVAAVH